MQNTFKSINIIHTTVNNVVAILVDEETFKTLLDPTNVVELETEIQFRYDTKATPKKETISLSRNKCIAGGRIKNFKEDKFPEVYLTTGIIHHNSDNILTTNGGNITESTYDAKKLHKAYMDRLGAADNDYFIYYKRYGVTLKNSNS